MINHRRRKFTVDGEVWEIVERIPSRRGLNVGLFDLGGLTRSGKKTIDVNPYNTTRQLRATLLHELGHVAWLKAGLVERYSERTEEVIVEGVTTWLFQVLEENKELARFILGL